MARAKTGGLRILLFVGAGSFGILGLGGILAMPVVDSVFGFRQGISSDGFVGVQRMYGSALVALATGYLLGALRPVRNRALLVPLFVAPLVTALVAIISAARGEIDGMNGGVLAAGLLVYCFLFFRFYPRPRPEEKREERREDLTQGGTVWPDDDQLDEPSR